MMEENNALATAADAEGGRQPVVLPHSEHGITRRDIDPSALKLLYRLTRNDFTAYLVGGGVRDLLLKRKPKDFDISTNARPDQIKGLFRNCLLIGRRFRLAHIRYGEKIIETSTFRRAPETNADPSDPEADLFQRDDNLFGSPEEDALRRDFTVNGLFYDIGSFSVIDYVGGIDDIHGRLIRSIGDPCIRFREDPVRMIRAVRFASRLDFSIAGADLAAIRKHGEELLKASPARLLEEIARLFAFSSGRKAVDILESTGLLPVLLPEIAAHAAGDASPFRRRLAVLDQGDIVLPDVTQALIFAVLLFDPVRAAVDAPVSGVGDRRRLERVRSFIDAMSARLAMPRKLKEKVFRIIGSQQRFANPGKRRVVEAMVRQDWFPEALAFAEIDSAVESRPPTLLNPWREMYADIVCSREEARQHGGRQRLLPGNDRPRQLQSGSRGGRERSDGETVTPASSLPGQGLSRSARRRRNRQRNKERRSHVAANPDVAASGSGETNVPAEGARDEGAGRTAFTAQTPLSIIEAARPMSSAAKAKLEAELKEEMNEAPWGEPVPVSQAKTARRRGRGRSAGKEKEAVGETVKAGDAAGPAPEPAPSGPLTAASFYARSDAKRSKQSQDGGGDGQNGQAAAKPSSARSSRGLDRSEEADTPMHWLDEI